MTTAAARPVRGAVPSPGPLLDRLTGRITMYRLVVVVLLGIAAIAVLLGSVGLLPFGAPGLLAALAVATGVGYGTNRLFGAIRRLRPHAESAVITGLLGFFLFLPLPTPAALGALAAAVAAGELSKYVLVIRGRHVLNPVAAGATVVLLSGLSGATWWVATPVLLPVVLLGGAVVVRRAGAWDLALPVLVVLLPGTAVGLLAAGSSLPAAVWTAVASFPTVFLAAFMLSEPLTAPPRRWQRILVSGLVGAVALLPLRVGWIAMTPELALVIGNLVAFGFGQRRRIRFVLEERASGPGGLLDLRLRGEAPLAMRPGQYVELSLPHPRQDGRGVRRAFSPASAPGTATVRIVTRTAERPSSFKRALETLPVGGAIAGSVVAGDFVPPRDRGQPVLWLAGGIGVTPFLAMAEAEPGRDAVLVWSVPEEDDPAWAAGALHGVRVLVTGGGGGSLPEGWTRIGDRLTLPGLLAAVPDAADRAAYASGSPGFVRAARRIARDAGATRVRTDRFLGY